jgi:hypothetical protein
MLREGACSPLLRSARGADCAGKRIGGHRSRPTRWPSASRSPPSREGQGGLVSRLNAAAAAGGAPGDQAVTSGSAMALASKTLRRSLACCAVVPGVASRGRRARRSRRSRRSSSGADSSRRRRSPPRKAARQRRAPLLSTGARPAPTTVHPGAITPPRIRLSPPLSGAGQ